VSFEAEDQNDDQSIYLYFKISWASYSTI